MKLRNVLYASTIIGLACKIPVRQRRARAISSLKKVTDDIVYEEKYGSANPEELNILKNVQAELYDYVGSTDTYLILTEPPNFKRTPK